MSDRWWAQLTIGPVPDDLRPEFDKMVAGGYAYVAPALHPALTILAELAPRLSHGDDSGCYLWEDSEMRAGLGGLSDVRTALRSLGVEYEGHESGASEYGFADERISWSPGDAQETIVTLAGGDPVITAAEFATVVRQAASADEAVDILRRRFISAGADLDL